MADMTPVTTGTVSALLDGLQRFLDAPGCDVEVVVVDGQYTVEVVLPEGHAGDAPDRQSPDAIQSPG